MTPGFCNDKNSYHRFNTHTMPGSLLGASAMLSLLIFITTLCRKNGLFLDEKLLA